jgi:hypothetical protein
LDAVDRYPVAAKFRIGTSTKYRYEFKKINKLVLNL